MRWIFLFCAFFSSACFAHQLRCEPELRPILEKLRSLPEGDAVIQKVLEQGPLSIEHNTALSTQFEGYWDAYSRAIYITQTDETSECSLITTLLFELHNALRTDDIEYMYSLASKRAIGRDDFIEQFEFLEYENALATAQIIDKGASLGYYPYGCAWGIADDFASHFEVQLRKGHSASLGALYDQLALQNPSG